MIFLKSVIIIGLEKSKILLIEEESPLEGALYPSAFKMNNCKLLLKVVSLIGFSIFSLIKNY